MPATTKHEPAPLTFETLPFDLATNILLYLSHPRFPSPHDSLPVGHDSWDDLLRPRALLELPHRLRLVSRYFNRLVTSTPKLWTYILVGSGVRPEYLRRRIDLFTGNCALEVHVHCWKRDEDDAKLLDLIDEYHERWGELQLDVDNLYSDWMLDRLRVLLQKSRFPRLEALTIDYTAFFRSYVRPVGHDLTLPTCILPRLRNISLICSTATLPEQFPPSTQRLRLALRPESLPLEPSGFLESFRLCYRNFKSLSISEAKFLPPQPEDIMLLNKLETLLIYNTTLEHTITLLNLLITPNLRHLGLGLTVGQNFDVKNGLKQWKSIRFSKLQHLSLWNRQKEEDGLPTMLIVELLQRLPPVKHVTADLGFKEPNPTFHALNDDRLAKFCSGIEVLTLHAHPPNETDKFLVDRCTSLKQLQFLSRHASPHVFENEFVPEVERLKKLRSVNTDIFRFSSPGFELSRYIHPPW